MGSLLAASSGILSGELGNGSATFVGNESTVALVSVGTGSGFSESLLGSFEADGVVDSEAVDTASFSWQLGNTVISQMSINRLRIIAFL
jgi:hypothetical protein